MRQSLDRSLAGSLFCLTTFPLRSSGEACSHHFRPSAAATDAARSAIYYRTNRFGSVYGASGHFKTPRASKLKHASTTVTIRSSWPCYTIASQALLRARRSDSMEHTIIPADFLIPCSEMARFNIPSTACRSRPRLRPPSRIAFAGRD